MSDAVWHARPFLGGYSGSKSAEWSFTNAARTELRAQNTLVLALHSGFMDTDLTKGYDMKKIDPGDVAGAALAAIESEDEEMLIDDFTRSVKLSLSTAMPMYLNPPAIS